MCFTSKSFLLEFDILQRRRRPGCARLRRLARSVQGRRAGGLNDWRCSGEPGGGLGELPARASSTTPESPQRPRRRKQPGCRRATEKGGKAGYAK